MPALRLLHYAVRTTDVERSKRFYEEILQLRAGFRPPFAFPGVWLYAGRNSRDLGLVHLIGQTAPEALGAYLGERRPVASGDGGQLDHIALEAHDWPAMRARCERAGEAYVERTVPALSLRQVFLTDPSGVTVELNFPD